jgi:hypothetical protein
MNITYAPIIDVRDILDYDYDDQIKTIIIDNEIRPLKANEIAYLRDTIKIENIYLICDDYE